MQEISLSIIFNESLNMSHHLSLKQKIDANPLFVCNDFGGIDIGETTSSSLEIWNLLFNGMKELKKIEKIVT